MIFALPFQVAWLSPSIVHNSSYLLGAHNGFAIFISSICPPHLSLRLCQFVGFHSGLFFQCLCRETIWHIKECWYHPALIACWIAQGLATPRRPGVTPIGHCHTYGWSFKPGISDSSFETCKLGSADWISSHLHLHLHDHNQSILISFSRLYAKPKFGSYTLHDLYQDQAFLWPHFPRSRSPSDCQICASYPMTKGH